MSATAQSATTAPAAPVVDKVALTPGVPLTLMVQLGSVSYSWVITVAASANGKTMIFTASSNVVIDSAGAPVMNSSGSVVTPS